MSQTPQLIKGVGHGASKPSSAWTRRSKRSGSCEDSSAATCFYRSSAAHVEPNGAESQIATAGSMQDEAGAIARHAAFAKNHV